MNLIIKELNKLDKTKKYIIGISGGPDSTFLLELLLFNKFDNLILCHVNYNTRATSIRDEDFCKEIAKNNLLPIHIKNTIYQGEGNFQEWARKERFNFFFNISKTENCSGIFLGHTKNDNLETYYFKKYYRNHSVFKGMQFKTCFDNNIIYRPLLKFWKLEIVKYLNTKKINYIIDESNFSDKYTRNKIRKINFSNSEKTFFLKEIAKNELKIKKINSDLENIFSKKVFLIENFLRFSYPKKQIYIAKLINQNISRKKMDNFIIFLTNTKNPNKKFDLNDKFIAQKKYKYFSITKNKQTEVEEYSYNLNLNNLTYMETKIFILSKKKDKELKPTYLPQYNNLIIRNWKQGDKIQNKRISKLFIKNKIPLNKRKYYPILLNQNNEIVSVLGIKNLNLYNSTMVKIFYKIK